MIIKSLETQVLVGRKEVDLSRQIRDYGAK